MDCKIQQILSSLNFDVLGGETIQETQWQEPEWLFVSCLDITRSIGGFPLNKLLLQKLASKILTEHLTDTQKIIAIKYNF